MKEKNIRLITWLAFIACLCTIFKNANALWILIFVILEQWDL